MSVLPSLLLTDANGKFIMSVGKKGLGDSEDTLEPIQHVHEYVTTLVLKLMQRKDTIFQLLHGDSVKIALEKGFCIDPTDLRI